VRPACGCDEWCEKCIEERSDVMEAAKRICADPDIDAAMRRLADGGNGVVNAPRIQTFEEWYARIGCRIVSDNERARAAFDFGYELRAGEAVPSQGNAEDDYANRVVDAARGPLEKLLKLGGEEP
jgi:hypothetical protein